MRSAGLAEMLATFGPAYLASHALPRGTGKVWRSILACRTAALGGHVESCTDCGTSRHVYHSCRNRHCPRCQTRAKEAWLAARRREVLPVPYFHLVAAASAASFLSLVRYGATNFGAISLTVWPKRLNSLAQKWAPEQASSRSHLRLSAFQQPLQQHIQKAPSFQGWRYFFAADF